MIEFYNWDALAIGQDCRLGKLAPLAAVDEHFQDVLLRIDSFPIHPFGQPMMLIEADPC